MVEESLRVLEEMLCVAHEFTMGQKFSGGDVDLGFPVKRSRKWVVGSDRCFGDGDKMWISGWPIDGTCLVESWDEAQTINQRCNVDYYTRIVDCDLKGYQGLLSISWVEHSTNKRIDCYFVNPNTGKEEYQTFSFPAELFPRGKTEPKKEEKFWIKLWAGTVGIGMKEDGSTKELTRSEQEALDDFLIKPKSPEPTMEIVEPKMIPTVTQDGGSLPIVVPVISVLSLIGVLARLLI